MSSYAHPEALVATGWLVEHPDDPSIRIVEVDVDTTSYTKGHIRNAIGWNRQTDLNDRVRRDIVDPRTFAQLNRAAGIGDDHTVVLYGDNNNWFAAWASSHTWFVLKYPLGVGDVKNYDGSWTEWGNDVAPIDVGEGVATARADVRCQ